MDSTLSFKTHVTKKCKAAMANFTKIRSIHHLLTQEASASLVLSLCVSHLDYCNSVLFGLPDVTISQMQRVQNMCAHLVLRRPKWESVTECLATLHWLPIKQQIKFKLCVLTYKLLHHQGPKYLQELIQYRSTDMRLRSSADPYLLLIPKTQIQNFCCKIIQHLSTHHLEWSTLPYQNSGQSTYI